jgi:hypothetical protein
MLSLIIDRRYFLCIKTNWLALTKLRGGVPAQHSVEDLTPLETVHFEQFRPDLHLNYASNLRRADGNE